MFRWTRTVVVEGPYEWVNKTRESSMADGLHIIGHRDGLPCTIRVETTEQEVLRGHSQQTTNGNLFQLANERPAEYERIHGAGSARIEVEEEAPAFSPQQPRLKPGLNQGGYL